MLYSTIVTMLAIVDILKPLDKNGREYTPDIEFEGGGLRQVTSLIVCARLSSEAKITFTVRCVLLKPGLFQDQSRQDVLIVFNIITCSYQVALSLVLNRPPSEVHQ